MKFKNRKEEEKLNKVFGASNMSGARAMKKYLDGEEIELTQPEKEKEHEERGIVRETMKYNETDLVVMCDGDDVIPVTFDDLRREFVSYNSPIKMMLDGGVSEEECFTNTLFGFVKLPDGDVYPSFDLRVVEKDDEYFVLPKTSASQRGAIRMENCRGVKPLNLVKYTSVPFSSVIGNNGDRITLGSGMTQGISKNTSAILDFRNASIRFQGANQKSGWVAYLVMNGALVLQNQLGTVIPIDSMIADNARGVVEYNFTFDNMDPTAKLYYLKEFLTSRTFKVPAKSVQTVKTCQAQIDNESISLNQLDKLAGILKYKFGVVALNEVSETLTIKLPKVSKKNEDIYNDVDRLTEEVYNAMVDGFKVPKSHWELEELLNRIKSDSLRAVDIETMIDLYEEKFQ